MLTYIHLCGHICIYVYIYIYAYICVYAHVYAYIRTHMHTHMFFLIGATAARHPVRKGNPPYGCRPLHPCIETMHLKGAGTKVSQTHSVPTVRVTHRAFYKLFVHCICEWCVLDPTRSFYMRCVVLYAKHNFSFANKKQETRKPQI